MLVSTKVLVPTIGPAVVGLLAAESPAADSPVVLRRGLQHAVHRLAEALVLRAVLGEVPADDLVDGGALLDGPNAGLPEDLVLDGERHVAHGAPPTQDKCTTYSAASRQAGG